MIIMYFVLCSCYWRSSGNAADTSSVIGSSPGSAYYIIMPRITVHITEQARRWIKTDREQIWRTQEEDGSGTREFW